MIIRITKDQKNYEDIKKSVYDRTLKGYKNKTRRLYDKADLVYLTEEGRLALKIDDMLAPRQITVKSESERKNDARFDEFIGSAKKDKKNRKKQ